MNTTRSELVTQAADAIRNATREVVDGKYNTADIKEAAERLIDLRTTFTDRYGKMDLQGNTYAYRQAVGEIMGLAGVADSDRPKVMNAIRYHVGNAIRARFTPEELEEHGFLKSTPLERQRVDRGQRAKMVRTAVSGEEPITDPQDVIAALRSAANLLDAVDLTALGAMDKKVASVFLEHLTEQVKAARSAVRG